MMRVMLMFLDVKRLHSSTQGKRWPCPQKGTMQISKDIIFRFNKYSCMVVGKSENWVL